MLLLLACAASDLVPTGLDPHPLEADPTDRDLVLSTALPATLMVKFHDDVGARLEGDTLAGNVTRARRALAEAGAELVPVVDRPDATRALLARAARSGVGADLFGMFRVDVDADRAGLHDLSLALLEDPAVEFAEITFAAPPPADIGSPTPDYTGYQGYLGPDPGLDAEAAWTAGYTGAGVRIADCEYDYDADHEDLVDAGIVNEAGQTGIYYQEHGTATLGEVVAVDNGYGVTGMAHGADAAFYTEWSAESGSRRTTAIVNACAESAEGDIVMLEMQASGPDGAYAPAEVDRSVWTAVRTCTAAGVIVVAAAGNGSANLDGSSYSLYAARGDSGAILVGAGGANTNHDRLYFSTYGTRVDVQGWGESVFTLGYSSGYTIDGDTHQTYTPSFNGTSSATPTVTGAAALLQEAAIDTWGAPLSSTEMRTLLEATGTPQGSSSASTPIGPLPDVAAALAALPTDADRDGWGAYAGDCNDGNNRIHPGVLRDRFGDGIDADCDGTDR